MKTDECEIEEDSDDDKERIEINDANNEKIKSVLEKFKKQLMILKSSWESIV